MVEDQGEDRGQPDRIVRMVVNPATPDPEGVLLDLQRGQRVRCRLVLQQGLHQDRCPGRERHLEQEVGLVRPQRGVDTGTIHQPGRILRQPVGDRLGKIGPQDNRRTIPLQTGFASTHRNSRSCGDAIRLNPRPISPVSVFPGRLPFLPHPRLWPSCPVAFPSVCRVTHAPRAVMNNLDSGTRTNPHTNSIPINQSRTNLAKSRTTSNAPLILSLSRVQSRDITTRSFLNLA